MKILMIGGTGILSTAVVDECINRGYEVTMLNRGNNKEFINSKARLIIGDFKNDSTIASKLEGLSFDVAIDFLVWDKKQLIHSLNILGKIAKQYVYISSAQAYDTSVDKVLDEGSRLINPLWRYSVEKAIAEKYLVDYCKREKINYTIVRPGVNYGSTRIPYGMFPEMGYHWTMVERIKAGKPIITWNNGENRLNLTRVEDFASGFVGLLGNPKAYNEDFNVVGDFVYSWKEVLTTLGELIGTEVKVIDIPVDFYANALDGDTREGLLGGRACNLVCSNAKMKSVIPGYKTKYELKEGLSMTLDFYAKNNYYKGFDYRWDGECDYIIKAYQKQKGEFIDKNLHYVYYGGDKKLSRKSYVLSNPYRMVISKMLLKCKFKLGTY